MDVEVFATTARLVSEAPLVDFLNALALCQIK